MPSKKFDVSGAELHMGILQNRLSTLKGKMNACMLKMDRVGKNAVGGVNPKDTDEADKQALEAEFDKYDKEYKIIEGNLIDYENKVLLLTDLSDATN